MGPRAGVDGAENLAPTGIRSPAHYQRRYCEVSRGTHDTALCLKKGIRSERTEYTFRYFVQLGIPDARGPTSPRDLRPGTELKA